MKVAQAIPMRERVKLVPALFESKRYHCYTAKIGGGNVSRRMCGLFLTHTVHRSFMDVFPFRCDHTVYVFSVVVMINFWIHLLTPLIFMLALCCNR